MLAPAPPPTLQVPFQFVPDLVAQRRVLLRKGWAYVSQRDLVSLVVQDFRKGLSLVRPTGGPASAKQLRGLPEAQGTWAALHHQYTSLYMETKPK